MPISLIGIKLLFQYQYSLKMIKSKDFDRKYNVMYNYKQVKIH